VSLRFAPSGLPYAPGLAMSSDQIDRCQKYDRQAISAVNYQTTVV
jgi:hypothetical protein